MERIVLLARNEAINKWLGEHPLVLGMMFLAIGLLIGGWGAYELKTGITRDKRGQVIEGGKAKFIAILRLVIGAGFIAFAPYKMLAR